MGGLQRIREAHPAYDPLHFPLLFPHGELGWYLAVRCHGDATSYNNNRISCREFVAYRLYIKANAYSLPHCAARLFLQWCVEEYVKIEQQMLRFIHQNQVNLCADLYHGIRDMELQDHNLAHVGRFIVLPATFNGGERYMGQLSVRNGSGLDVWKPDLFITITCNPQWPEVIENFLPNRHPGDRPDILARVFRLKLKAVLDDLLKKNCLGIVMAYIYVIQFQKRGLPNSHILIILNHQHKPRRRDDYDLFVSAEIPDPDEHPVLHETVTKCMMHGPCGYLKANAVL
jgi:hypothetical protein